MMIFRLQFGGQNSSDGSGKDGGGTSSNLEPYVAIDVDEVSVERTTTRPKTRYFQGKTVEKTTSIFPGDKVTIYPKCGEVDKMIRTVLLKPLLSTV